MKRILTMTVTTCALIAAIGMFDSASSHSRANAEEHYRGQPDLVITKLMPGASYENRMWVYVYNQGTATAGKSTLGVLWSFGRDKKSCFVATDALTPHTGEWISVIPGDAKLFAHNSSTRYIADYYNVVAESNETNNEADTSY